MLVTLFEHDGHQGLHYNCTGRRKELHLLNGNQENDWLPADWDPKYKAAIEYSGIIVFNVLSALFSGLVLGLLSLDITELEILKKCGTEKERQYASAIIPMRRHSNLLLCSLVIGNVVVNAGLQLLLDKVFPGLIGFISTTVCITLVGEILPQAVCARHGLAIGAKTIWITWIVIVITFPLAYPLSVFLDCALGEEIAFVYDRERLQEYIRITKNYNNLDANEVNIIMGALKIKKVTVGSVMTKLKDVFMLPLDTIINHPTIITIIKRGFSRVPVFDKSRRNIVGLLMVKDLALVNPYQDVTLKSLLLFYKHPVISVDESHTLEVIFNHFREGKSHMALVREHRRRDIVGIVTLEDIIEEVLQVEINDETDIVFDNRDLKARPDAQIPADLEALHIHLIDAIARRRAKEKLLAQQGIDYNNYRAVRLQQQQQQQQQVQQPKNSASTKRKHHTEKTPPLGATQAPQQNQAGAAVGGGGGGGGQTDNKPAAAADNKPST